MDANFAIQHFLSDSIFKLAANEEMDAIYAEETNEFDRDHREELLKEFMAVMREEAPFLFLFQSPLLYGLNPRVTGFPPTADDHPHVDAVALQD
jgi:ABC-type transport system substrate-binding protein